MTGPVRGGDVGSATLELAVALPAVVLVLAFCLGGVHAAAAQSRMQEAAAAAARSAARDEGALSGLVARMVPGASVTVEDDGALLCAVVRGNSVLVGSVVIPISARSCALSEGR